MKQLARASIFLFAAQAIALVLKMIGTKFLAIYIGPSGLSVVNQLIFFYVWLVNFGTFGVTGGLTKYISEYYGQGNIEGIKKLLVTSILILTGGSLCLVAASLALSSQISYFLLNTTEYASLVVLICLLLPINILVETLASLIYGYSLVKQMGLFIIFSAVVEIASLIPLIRYFGIKGPILTSWIVISSQLAIAFFFYHHYAPVKVGIKNYTRKFFELKTSRKVFHYGFVAMLILLIKNLFFTIVFRKLIITFCGIEQNGIYSPAFGFSTQMFFLISTTVYGYSLPRISAAKTEAEISTEVNQLLRGTIFLMFPSLFCLISYRTLIINILYTSQFLPVINVMPVQFIGDFFKVIVIAVSLPLFARADLKAMFGYEVGMGVLFYFLAHFMVSHYALDGAAWAYFILYFIYLGLVFPYVRRRFGVRINKQNLLLLAVSLIMLICSRWLPQDLLLLIPLSIFMLTAWAALVLNTDERRYVMDKALAIGRKTAISK